MSEDVMKKLGRFTPVAVDRDALLFAAGRASAKPSRFWRRIATLLAVSQMLTLAAWLTPRQKEVPAVPAVPVFPGPSVPIQDHVITEIDPYSLLALRQNPDPQSAANNSPSPTRPPLLAFTRNYQP